MGEISHLHIVPSKMIRIVGVNSISTFIDEITTSQNERFYAFISEKFTEGKDEEVVLFDMYFSQRFQPQANMPLKAIFITRSIGWSRMKIEELADYAIIIFDKDQLGKTCTPNMISADDSTGVSQLIYYNIENEYYIPFVGFLDNKNPEVPSDIPPIAKNAYGFYLLINNVDEFNIIKDNVENGIWNISQKWAIDTYEDFHKGVIVQFDQNPSKNKP